MKKIKYILIWLFIAAYLGVILGFVSKEEGKLSYKGVDIIIHDSLTLKFIDEGMITRLLHTNGTELTGRAITDIHIQDIENRILSIKTVRTAEVYFTVRGIMVIEIYQRKPVVRIIDRSGQGFYIDEEGYIMPTSRQFCSHVLVVNGNIDEACMKARNIEEPGKNMDLLRDIIKIVNYIRDDEFWESQIMQIYINNRKEFEFIPRVGAHIIEFGTADDMEAKFEKLWILYEEGFRNKGWNHYERINLKYKNQVVCTKR